MNSKLTKLITIFSVCTSILDKDFGRSKAVILSSGFCKCDGFRYSNHRDEVGLCVLRRRSQRVISICGKLRNPIQTKTQRRKRILNPFGLQKSLRSFFAEHNSEIHLVFSFIWAVTNGNVHLSKYQCGNILLGWNFYRWERLYNLVNDYNLGSSIRFDDGLNVDAQRTRWWSA